jgi:hypothetical protein
MIEPDEPKAGMLRITIEQTPSPTDPEGADEFYKALGILIVAWGRLEGHFVVCLLTLLNLAEGKELGTQLPMNFDHRAVLWRKAFETMAPLEPFRESALQLLSEIKEVASDRNTIVHALWERFAPNEPTSIDILTIKPKKRTKDGIETRRKTVTTAMLKDVGEEANRLNWTLEPLSRFLTQRRSSQNPPPADIHTV